MVRTNMTQKEIAKEIGITEATISKWKHHDDFDQIRLREERLYLGDLVGPALRTMKELLNASSEAVRLNAASDILNRTGFKPSETHNLYHSGNIGVQIIDNIPKSRGEPDGTGSA